MQNFLLYQGSCFDIMPQFLDQSFDMVFADPPYFLSNDGLTIKNGKIQSVNKGSWDRLDSQQDIYTFNYQWLALVKQKLKDDGTIWISGTHHNIFLIGQALSSLNFKILNMITWEKKQGKHPTQKPLGLLSRIILASTQANALILDPFSGSATTGIAANLFNRRFIGIEQEASFLELAKNRYLALDDIERQNIKQKIRCQISLI